jgi:hypothetical protein
VNLYLSITPKIDYWPVAGFPLVSNWRAFRIENRHLLISIKLFFIAPSSSSPLSSPSAPRKLLNQFCKPLTQAIVLRKSLKFAIAADNVAHLFASHIIALIITRVATSNTSHPLLIGFEIRDRENRSNSDKLSFQSCAAPPALIAWFRTKCAHCQPLR